MGGVLGIFAWREMALNRLHYWSEVIIITSNLIDCNHD